MSKYRRARRIALILPSEVAEAKGFAVPTTDGEPGMSVLPDGRYNLPLTPEAAYLFLGMNGQEGEASSLEWAWQAFACDEQPTWLVPADSKPGDVLLPGGKIKGKKEDAGLYAAGQRLVITYIGRQILDNG